MVRPWALAGPVIVLLIAAPLLRPLWSPGSPSPRERVTLESVRALLHGGTLAVDTARLQPADPVLAVGGRAVAQDPPAFSVALGGVGWAIERGGVTYDANPNLFAYLLTLFAVTLPTAVAGGLLYRTGRWFELSRSWRFGLALACVLASGWVSYATVLLPHAPAAAGVVAALASVAQFAQAPRPGRAVGWLFVGGFCGAGAMVVEPLAGWALLTLLAAAAVTRTRARWRVAGVVLAVAGAAGPVALHATLNRALVGDLRPPRWHLPAAPPSTAATPAGLDDADAAVSAGWAALGRGVERVLTLTVGRHGLLSHFPVLGVGLLGAAAVVRRHWTPGMKALAGGTLAALGAVLVYKALGRPDEVDADFAAPRLVVLAPAVLLWSGAWLRRRHAPAVWAAAGVALAVSVAVSLLGATAAAPPGGYAHYTAVGAVERLSRAGR